MKSLKIQWILIILLILNSCASKEKKEENLCAFSKLYGYVRWFHPSDEARKINWNKFAAYGAEKVKNAPDEAALRDSLLKLFKPIAPTLKIYVSKDKDDIHPKLPVPEDKSGFKPVAWQHMGGSVSGENNTYKSARTNREKKLEKDYIEPQLFSFRDMKEELDGKQLRLSASVKCSGKASIFLDFVSDKELKKISRGNQKINSKDFMHPSWKRCKIIKEGDASKDHFIFGIINKDKKTVLIDNFRLEVKKDNKWHPVSLFNQSLNKSTKNKKPKGFILNSSSHHTALYTPVDVRDSIDYIVKIKFEENPRLFYKIPDPGEFMIKSISPELTIALPLTLWGNEEYTFPRADTTQTNALKDKLDDYFSDHPYDWVGSIIVSWNMLQHFYPYHQEVNVKWEKALDEALYKTHKASEGKEYVRILKKMTAKLKDGHMFVFSPYREKHFYPPGYWKWIENRLVITKVISDTVSLKKGDIIRKINGKKAKEYFSENQQYIPAPTDGYLNYRSQFAALRGSENETMKLSLISQEEKNKSVTLKHTISERTFQSKMKDHGPAFRRMNNGILYFDLTNMSFRKIKQRFDEIAQSRGVIFDMRGYPEQSVSYLLPHLMEQEDTIHDWLKSPIFVYPDQKNKNEYIESGWGLNPESPTIDKPVVFLANGKAISYAETCMQIVDYYKLGKIIGQPTAGTNGNVNSVDLPVGKLRFTGLKVTNLDGSQHFAKGVQPDIFVSQTIEGIRKGKDEYIERGVEYLKQQ